MFIHGSSSSNVTLSVELTNFEHTDLSINSESTEVDASPVNDDNANANEGNAEDDVIQLALKMMIDVVVSMVCVYPRSHGGDAGGTPPRTAQPARTGPVRKAISTCSLVQYSGYSVMGNIVYYGWGQGIESTRNGHYEDLIETWRKSTRGGDGEFKTKKTWNEIHQAISDEVVPCTNCQNMSGYREELPVVINSAGRSQAFPDVISREEMDRILRQRDQEAELFKEATRGGAAWIAERLMNWLDDRELAGEDNDVGDNEEADSQQSSGDYSKDEEGDNEEVQDESEESD
ncbi:hypothetical protein Tco_0676402 [Tanacetum coccineum]